MNEGKAPDSLAAFSKAIPGTKQPIFAYPQQAIDDGKGRPAEISSYPCR